MPPSAFKTKLVNESEPLQTNAELVAKHVPRLLPEPTEPDAELVAESNSGPALDSSMDSNSESIVASFMESAPHPAQDIPSQETERPDLVPTLKIEARYDFIELLARSNFSFLQGGSHPDEMVLQAKSLGYRGLALCDVNGMYGIVRGHQAAHKHSLFDASQLADMDENGEPLAKFHYLCGVELTPHDASPLALLPMNKDGYSSLCRLITSAKRNAPKGEIKISLREIINANENLIAFPLPPWNEAQLKEMQVAFQDRIYLPVHRDFTWETVQFYQHALHLERALGILPFATMRPLYHIPDRKPLHDVLTCLLHKTNLFDAHTVLTLNRERYLKKPNEIHSLFRERPDLLTRTLEIAQRVQFDLRELRYRYPQETLPPGKTAGEFLCELVQKGLGRRYGRCQDENFMARVHAQVEKELLLIQKMEYEDYFLTLWDICLFARKAEILHQGRGSAANSVICFALGLTSVDPIRFGLLFERFISLERGEPPDIDIDFEHERREEVIQYIYTKYGSARAAMVSTVITYRARMAIREVAKAFGVSLENTNAMVKFMGREGLSRLLTEAGDISRFGLTTERFQLILQVALELQGFPRHLGIHSGGFVIAHEPLIDIVPVESATMTDRFVVQWNKDDINHLGLMKLDILSLGMLTALRKTFHLLRDKKQIALSLPCVPHGDGPTYAMIQKADTVGVFQIESRAQMSLLPRLRPKSYYDLVIEVAIVRPGPIQGGMVHPYLKRRAGTEKITYAHPALQPFLAKTLGIPLFQEQVMQIVSAVAGFTPGEADELRRIMSSAWKKKPVMDGLRMRVINGMLSNGLSQVYAEQIYQTIEGFSSYGFPESHAASFALLTYASCYLKKHHPDAFTCALLNSQPMGFYSSRQLVADAQRAGVKFLRLDVQRSTWDYQLESPAASRTPHATPNAAPNAAPNATPNATLNATPNATPGGAPNAAPDVAPRSNSERRAEGISRSAQSATADASRGIRAPRSAAAPGMQCDPRSAAAPALNPGLWTLRVGFRSVHGLRQKMIEDFTAEREKNGAYKSVSDFVRRSRLPRHVLIRLAAAGALESFGLSARQAIWNLQGMSFDSDGLLYGQHSLLDESEQALEERKIPIEDSWQSVQREYRTKGFSVEHHPLGLLRPQLRGYVTATQLSSLRHHTRVHLAGLMSLIQKPPTAKGMCFVSLEDETGIFNLVITPDLYQQVRLTLINVPLLDVEGTLESREGVHNIKVIKLQGLRFQSENSRLVVDKSWDLVNTPNIKTLPTQEI